MLVIEPLGATPGAAEEGLRLGTLPFLAQEITQRNRGVDLRDVVVFLIAQLELLDAGGLRARSVSPASMARMPRRLRAARPPST